MLKSKPRVFSKTDVQESLGRAAFWLATAIRQHKARRAPPDEFHAAAEYMATMQMNYALSTIESARQYLNSKPRGEAQGRRK